MFSVALGFNENPWWLYTRRTEDGFLLYCDGVPSAALQAGITIWGENTIMSSLIRALNSGCDFCDVMFPLFWVISLFALFLCSTRVLFFFIALYALGHKNNAVIQ